MTPFLLGTVYLYAPSSSIKNKETQQQKYNRSEVAEYIM